MIDFDSLYRQHAPAVYRFALSLSGSRAVAEDITSETFVRVWTARERVDLTTVIGYLLTIARRLHLQGVRHERRRASLDEDPVDHHPGVEVVAGDRAALEHVLADLQALPELDRAAVLLRANDDMPYEQIAAALGISPGAARVKVHRARTRLTEARLHRERGNT